MTSFASPASWLPAAIARAVAVAVAPSPTEPAPTTGRHLAPDVPGVVRIAAPEDLTRTGRHAEPEWSRGTFDPQRDAVDPFDWLGFTAAQR
ncbi:MAG: hypothetical protein JWR45_1049 [Blastococcus sp.]|jgi:hypothetical protein|nr:hypothetical protein [Blastococcus sp.]